MAMGRSPAMVVLTDVALCLYFLLSEKVLGVVHSKGLHDPGPVRWPLALCLLVHLTVDPLYRR